MPFQSEKQRKYLHANHPEIAKRWERDYATGGISNLFKLKEGGNIRLQPHTASDLLVQKTLSGERPKYQPPGHVDAPAPSSSSSGGGDAGHLSHNVSVSQGGTKPDTVTRDAGDAGHLTHNVPVSQGETKPDKVGGRNMLGDYDPNNTTGWKEKGLHIDSMGNETNPVDRGEMSAKDYNEFLTETVEYINPKTGKLTKYTKKKKFGQPYEPPKKKSGFWGMVGKGILTLATAGAGAGLFGKDLMRVAGLYNKYNQGKKIYNTLKKGEVNLFGKKLNLNRVTNKLKTSDQKLMASLPKGHPERIALEAQMKVRTPPKHDGEGGSTTSIKIEDIEAVNDANAEQVQLKKYREMELAAYRAMIQQQEDRSKQMAYWQMMMQPYMAAQGGRVPAGYNTGGLSNLFRLKNV